MKHTPGPWKIEDKALFDLWIVRPWDNSFRPEHSNTFGSYLGAHICELHWNDGIPTKEQALANARLIAQAPAMMLALKAIAEMKVDENTDFRELAALCIGIAKVQVEKARTE